MGIDNSTPSRNGGDDIYDKGVSIRFEIRL